MVELEYRTARPGGVTLVAVRLDNRVEAPGVDAHRVRLVSQLDGPTWPPRIEGVPAAPWDGNEAAVVVPTGQVGSLGFASPEPPVEPPVAVADVEPADPAAGQRGEEPTPTDVLRVLGDPSPPRDAVQSADASGAVQSDAPRDTVLSPARDDGAEPSRSREGSNRPAGRTEREDGP